MHRMDKLKQILRELCEQHEKILVVCHGILSRFLTATNVEGILERNEKPNGKPVLNCERFKLELWRGWYSAEILVRNVGLLWQLVVKCVLRNNAIWTWYVHMISIIQFRSTVGAGIYIRTCTLRFVQLLISSKLAKNSNISGILYRC